jgi:hypothetical protein
MAAIISFDSLPEQKQIMNETLSTMGRQLWDGFKEIFKGENWTSNDASFENYLKAKRKYFNELYTIKPPLKKKLIGWINQTPGAFCVSPSEMSQLLSANNTKKVQQTAGYHDPTTGAVATTTHEYEVSERNEYTLHMKARANNARNSLTYCSVPYVIHDGNKAYLVVFTFDSDGIDVCQVATKNKYAKGGMSEGISFVRLPQWQGVQKSEYEKED